MEDAGKAFESLPLAESMSSEPAVTGRDATRITRRHGCDWARLEVTGVLVESRCLPGPVLVPLSLPLFSPEP